MQGCSALAARNKLLAEEIELRSHIERVAAQRRALPPGGQIAKDFELTPETGPTRVFNLFGNKDTLMVYSMMYGPLRKGPCPMCTSFLDAWNGIAINLRGMLVFTNVQSVDRIIFSIFSRFNEDWKSHTLELFTQTA